MKSEAAAFISIALVLICSSVFAADDKQQAHLIDVPVPLKDTQGSASKKAESSKSDGGTGSVEAGAWGIGSNGGGFSAGFSHGGVYGSGQKCKWGCCSAAFGYSHPGGGYIGCTCCHTAAEAKAYRATLPKTQINN